MRKYIRFVCYFIVVVQFSSCSFNKKMKVEVQILGEKEQIQKIEFYDLAYPLMEPVSEATIDNKGSFKLNIPIESPSYFLVVADKYSALFYAEPKDEIRFSATIAEDRINMEYKGDRQKENTFIKESDKISNSFLIESEKSMKTLNESEYSESMDVVIQKMNRKIDSLSTHLSLDKTDFLVLDRQRLLSTFYSQRLNYSIYKTRENTSVYEPQDGYYSFLDSINLNDQRFVKIPSYRQLVFDYYRKIVFDDVTSSEQFSSRPISFLFLDKLKKQNAPQEIKDHVLLSKAAQHDIFRDNPFLPMVYDTLKANIKDKRVNKAFDQLFSDLTK